ncbi:hypothetical protein [Methyloglobulus sp.]|uniref:hypothetical protein n=1 Tax=Methyloglobulus sp. TaxID=2518622 RepID=UPI0032B816E9
MNKRQLLAAMLAVILFDANAAMDHSGHGGGGSGNGGSDVTCMHPRLDRIQPAHLATVAPGSGFSFVVFNIDNPKLVSVMVKQKPVEIETEFKDPFYIVRGKIPDSLRNTAARIDVKIDAKYNPCKATQGWLVKISEN